MGAHEDTRVMACGLMFRRDWRTRQWYLTTSWGEQPVSGRYVKLRMDEDAGKGVETT